MVGLGVRAPVERIPWPVFWSRVYEPCYAVSWPGLAARRPEPVMNLARSVADVLAEHVSFEVECIDRMYCNVYVRGCRFF